MFLLSSNCYSLCVLYNLSFFWRMLPGRKVTSNHRYIAAPTQVPGTYVSLISTRSCKLASTLDPRSSISLKSYTLVKVYRRHKKPCKRSRCPSACHPTCSRLAPPPPVGGHTWRFPKFRGTIVGMPLIGTTAFGSL